MGNLNISFIILDNLSTFIFEWIILNGHFYQQKSSTMRFEMNYWVNVICRVRQMINKSLTAVKIEAFSI